MHSIGISCADRVFCVIFSSHLKTLELIFWYSGHDQHKLLKRNDRLHVKNKLSGAYNVLQAATACYSYNLGTHPSPFTLSMRLQLMAVGFALTVFLSKLVLKHYWIKVTFFTDWPVNLDQSGHKNTTSIHIPQWYKKSWSAHTDTSMYIYSHVVCIQWSGSWRQHLLIWRARSNYHQLCLVFTE